MNRTKNAILFTSLLLAACSTNASTEMITKDQALNICKAAAEETYRSVEVLPKVRKTRIDKQSAISVSLTVNGNKKLRCIVRKNGDVFFVKR